MCSHCPPLIRRLALITVGPTGCNRRSSLSPAARLWISRRPGYSTCTRQRVWQPNIGSAAPGSGGGTGPVGGRAKLRVPLHLSPAYPRCLLVIRRPPSAAARRGCAPRAQQERRIASVRVFGEGRHPHRPSAQPGHIQPAQRHLFHRSSPPPVTPAARLTARDPAGPGSPAAAGSRLRADAARRDYALHGLAAAVRAELPVWPRPERAPAPGADRERGSAECSQQIGANGERVLVAGYGDTSVGGHLWWLGSHCAAHSFRPRRQRLWRCSCAPRAAGG